MGYPPHSTQRPGNMANLEILSRSLKRAAACGEDATPTPLPATAVPATTTAPAPTAPPAPRGSPLASLTFNDVDYVYGSSAELPSDEGTVFVIDGIEINLDDLKMIGTTYEGNAPGISEGLQVYRSKVTGDANAVYTFEPAQSMVNPEDGQIFEFPAVWIRWTTR